MKAFKLKCTLEEYLKHPAVSSSGLRTIIDKSPAHYYYDLTHPKEATPAMAFGSAMHQALLEPKLFKSNVVVPPIFEGRTKKGELTTSMNCTEVKDKSDAWHLENHGKMIVSSDYFETIQGMLNSISKHEKASQMIGEGRAEESLFWTDAETGIECKARPDFLHDGHIIVDLKTCEDASYSGFQKSLVKYNYAVQAAMYLEAACAVFERNFDKFEIIAIEKEPPYEIHCFHLDDAIIREGQELYYSALKTLKKCRDTDIYPGYGHQLTPISLPSWAYKMEQP